MVAIRVAASVVVIALRGSSLHVLAVGSLDGWTLPSLEIQSLVSPLADQLTSFLLRRTGLAPSVLHQAATIEEGGVDGQLRIAFYGLIREWYTNAEGVAWADVYSVLPDADRRAHSLHRSREIELGDLDRYLVERVLERLRVDVLSAPVLAVLSPKTFTLSYLQELVESVLGRTLHTQNFRRLIRDSGLLAPARMQVKTGNGRPAELYSFVVPEAD